MAPTERHEREAGVAFVELLVALALIAVIAGAMAGFIGQLRVVAGLQREAEAAGELAAAAQLVQRSLSAARQLPLLPAAGTEPAFQGDAGGLRFTAVSRSGFRSLALREVTIAAAAFPGRLALVETVRPRRPEGGGAAETFLVADPITAVHFDYMDADGAILPEWRAPTLPAAVRITLSRTLGPGRPVTVQALARLH